MIMQVFSRARLLFIAACFALLLCSHAASAKNNERRLQSTLYDYASTFRWGDVEQVISFFDIGEKAKKFPTAFEIARWKQWRVVGYSAQPYALSKNGFAEQIVKIELSNVNTSLTRSIIDHQRWRYDKPTKTWRLISGLPSLSP